MRESSGDSISLRPVGAPPSETLYKPFIAVSLLMAVLLGFAIGLHIPVTRLLDAGRPERTIDLIQAHGQVQLLGFGGLYVIGMSLRLMPRFAGGRLAFESLVTLALWLIAPALALRAIVMPWLEGDAHAAVLLVSSFAPLAGAGCYLLVVVGTLAVEARRADASSLAFLLGATLLFLALAAGSFAAVDAVVNDHRALPYLANNAVLQLQLSGFLMLFIVGVSSRALPAMVGLTRPVRSAHLAAVALFAAVLVMAACLLYLEYGDFAGWAVRLSGLAYLGTGTVFLLAVWAASILRPAANRIRPASRPHLWLVRSAFVWLTVAGLIAIYAGGRSLLDGALPSPFLFDAVRHSLGLGVVTMLIVGMSLMILPEFAGQRLAANQQAVLSIVLAVMLNLAALLRVLPSLFGNAWTFDERNLSMAAAGTLAEVAMLLFAFTLLRLLLRSRRAAA